MNTHGFERIDDVLAHLQAEMDANIMIRHHRHDKRFENSGAGKVAADCPKPQCKDQKQSGPLRDAVIRPFEALSKRLRSTE